MDRLVRRLPRGRREGGARTDIPAARLMADAADAIGNAGIAVFDEVELVVGICWVHVWRNVKAKHCLLVINDELCQKLLYQDLNFIRNIPRLPVCLNDKDCPDMLVEIAKVKFLHKCGQGSGSDKVPQSLVFKRATFILPYPYVRSHRGHRGLPSTRKQISCSLVVRGRAARRASGYCAGLQSARGSCPPLGTSVSMEDEDDDDDDQAEADLELTKKVAIIMQPLMKKMRKQAWRITTLEALVTKQTQESAQRLPVVEAGVRDLTASLEEAMDRTRRDLGERVLHSDHARVEVGLSGGLAAMQSVVEEARVKATASEMMVKNLLQRLEDSEASNRRAIDEVLERIASVRESVSDEAARAESRRSELQLHLAELSAKMHAELMETRRHFDSEIQMLNASVAAAVKRTEVTDRLNIVDEAAAISHAKSERQAAQLAALEQGLTETSSALRARASTSDLAKLKADVEAAAASGATKAELEGASQQEAMREQSWERRYLAVERTAAASMREVRQLSANLDELGSRLASFAPQVAVDELGESLKGLSVVLTTQAKGAISSARTAGESSAAVTSSAANSAEMERLRADMLALQHAMDHLVTGTEARFGLKADLELTKRLEKEVHALHKAVESKLATTTAEKLLEFKADAVVLQQITAANGRSATELGELQKRIEAAETALSKAQREATDATDQSRSSSRLVAQLQQSADKHWQITRSGREEQAQLVKAVRALLLDAELRVNEEVTATHPPRTETVNEYGAHGWSSPTTGGGGSSSARCTRVSDTTPTTRPGDRDSGDVLTRRRRLLAGASIGSGGSPVTVPEPLALPGSVTLPPPGKSPVREAQPAGATTERRSAATRSRVQAGGPYPSLAAAGILVPIPQRG